MVTGEIQLVVLCELWVLDGLYDELNKIIDMCEVDLGVWIAHDIKVVDSNVFLSPWTPYRLSILVVQIPTADQCPCHFSRCNGRVLKGFLVGNCLDVPDLYLLLVLVIMYQW